MKSAPGVGSGSGLWMLGARIIFHALANAGFARCVIGFTSRSQLNAAAFSPHQRCPPATTSVVCSRHASLGFFARQSDFIPLLTPVRSAP